MAKQIPGSSQACCGWSMDFTLNLSSGTIKPPPSLRCREKSWKSINDHFAWKAVLKDSYASCCIHLLTKELSLITSRPILSCRSKIRPGICWCLVAIPWHLRDYGFLPLPKRSSWLQEGHIGYGRTKTNNIHIVQHETRSWKGPLSRQLILDAWKLFSKKNIQGMSAAPQDLTYHRGHPNGGPATETQNSGWSRYIDKGQDGG